MAEPFAASGDTADVMCLPPRRKLRAALPKALQQIDKGGIAGPQIVRGAKLGHHALGLVGPGRSEQASRMRVGQHANECVAVLFRQAAEGKDLVSGGVPRQDIPATASDVSGLSTRRRITSGTLSREKARRSAFEAKARK